LRRENKICDELNKKLIDYTSKDYMQQEQVKKEVESLFEVLIKI